MLAWCQSRLAEASQFDSAVVVDQMALAPKLTDPVVYIPGTIDFANDVHIGKLSTDAVSIIMMWKLRFIRKKTI